MKAQNHHPKETRNLYNIEYMFISRLKETIKNKVFKNNTMHELVVLLHWNALYRSFGYKIGQQLWSIEDPISVSRHGNYCQ